MSIRTDAASARRSPIAKAVASVGVLAAAAAVAGMGSFGTFTDSTSPVDTNVDTGVLSINLSPAASYATVPVTPGALLPGDRTSTPFDLVNDGNLAWEAVTFKSWATSSSALDSDTVNGLQLTVESCSDSWTVAGSGYVCGGDVRSFYTGPIVMDRALEGAASLTAGGVDHLLATITFPTTGGDALKNNSSRLAFQFNAVQRNGAAR